VDLRQDPLRLRRVGAAADGRLQEVSWEKALGAVAERLKGLAGERIAAIAGDLCEAESVYALQDLMSRLGSPNLDCRQDGAQIDGACRAGYLFNTTIAGIEQADAVLIVGSNPRKEAALINARLRKTFLAQGLEVGLVGAPADLNYPVDYIGAGPRSLEELAAGKHRFAEVLRGAERPMIIVGMGALRRPDGAAVLALCRAIAEDFAMVREGWNGFNLLHTAAGRVGALELGFLPGEGGRDLEGILSGAEAGEVEAVYLLGADEIDMSRLGGRDRHEPAGRRLRHLPRPPRRCRRAPRRRGAAGRGLHRKERHLRQYRGAGAACQAGGLSARRCARGLDDPAGPFGCLGPYPAL
jgi:NADH-quinone oxidoreductase subunit G